MEESGQVVAGRPGAAALVVGAEAEQIAGLADLGGAELRIEDVLAQEPQQGGDGGGQEQSAGDQVRVGRRHAGQEGALAQVQERRRHDGVVDEDQRDRGGESEQEAAGQRARERVVEEDE